MKTNKMRKKRIELRKSLKSLSEEIGIEISVLKKIEDDIKYAKNRELLLISSALNCTHYDLL